MYYQLINSYIVKYDSMFSLDYVKFGYAIFYE